MIRFCYSTAPNPMKVALCQEEMGNPNAKVPSIVDGDVTMFSAGAAIASPGV